MFDHELRTQLLELVSHNQSSSRLVSPPEPCLSKQNSPTRFVPDYSSSTLLQDRVGLSSIPVASILPSLLSPSTRPHRGLSSLLLHFRPSLRSRSLPTSSDSFWPWFLARSGSFEPARLLRFLARKFSLTSCLLVLRFLASSEGRVDFPGSKVLSDGRGGARACDVPQ